MKKCIFFVSVVLGSLFLFSDISFANEVSNELQEVNSAISVNDEDAISFEELTEEEADYFLSKGFTESDEYFSVVTVQSPLDSTGINARAVNVVKLTGSTQKVSNTQSRTEYIISASRAPFIKLDAGLDMGGKKTVRSSVNINGAYVYKGGIYATYRGKSQYLAYTLNIQYKTTWGIGTASKKVGGLIIGV
ncbi:hypothetical protein KCT31_002715 [Enterococcus faecalis]|nr:hypothetical protein [Enterococcus faecalis]